MTEHRDCLWCYGTSYVHTTHGKLGDVIAGPAICSHDGSWRVVTDPSEQAEHRAALVHLAARARAVDTRDFTEPRRDKDNDR